MLRPSLLQALLRGAPSPGHTAPMSPDTSCDSALVNTCWYRALPRPETKLSPCHYTYASPSHLRHHAIVNLGVWSFALYLASH